MIKAIIFDFDGVLAESVDIKTRAFAELYKEFGTEIVEKVVDYHLKNGGMSRFRKFRYYHNVLLGKNLSEGEELELGSRFSRLVEEMVIKAPWVSGAKEFLEEFHQKLNLFVASGTPDDELIRIVKARNMDYFFSAVYGSSKDKGEIIRTIIETNGFSCKNVIMVGDAMSDYNGASEAGVRFVGRVTGDKQSPFPSGTLFFDDPFNYLSSSVSQEFVDEEIPSLEEWSDHNQYLVDPDINATDR